MKTKSTWGLLLTPEEVARMQELHRWGATTNELADDYGISRATVRKYLNVELP